MTIATIALFLQVSAGIQQLPITYEPRPAHDWVQSSTFRCSHMTIRISGYGNARPSNRDVEIVAEGRPITGRTADDLRRDLAGRRAVYRLGALCSRDGRAMELRIASGERSEGGAVLYRVGGAFIHGGTVQNYTGLEPATADDFWFR
jgi:hypothetical protein